MNKMKVEEFEKVFENVYEMMEYYGKNKYVYGFGYLESLMKKMITELKKNI